MIKTLHPFQSKTVFLLALFVLASVAAGKAQEVKQKGLLKLNSYKTEDFSYYNITGPITQSDGMYSKGLVYFEFISGADEYLSYDDFREFTQAGKLQLPSTIARDFEFVEIYPEKQAIPGTNNSRPANIAYKFEVYNDDLVNGQLSLIIKNDGNSDDFWLDDETWELASGGIVLEPGKVNLISVQVERPPEFEASGQLQVNLNKEGGSTLTEKEKVTLEQIGGNFKKTVESLSDVAQFNELPFGGFRIVIDDPRFEPVTQNVSIQPDNPKRSVTIELSLRRFPLKVTTNAESYSIDVTDPETNRLVGNNSVRSVSGESVFELPKGRYRLVATADGYEQKITFVDLESAGKTEKITMEKRSGPVASTGGGNSTPRIQKQDKGGLGWLWIALGAGAAGGAYYFISSQGGGSGGGGYGSPPALPTPSN